MKRKINRLAIYKYQGYSKRPQLETLFFVTHKLTYYYEIAQFEDNCEFDEGFMKFLHKAYRYI